MITILLVSTFLNPPRSSAPASAPVRNSSVIVAPGQPNAVAPVTANSLARDYKERMLVIHKLIGFGLAFLLFSRILIELTHQSEEKVGTRMKNAIGLFKKNDENKTEYRHYLSVKIGYLVFYILILTMAITGLGLAFGRQFTFLRPMHRSLITIHSFVQYFIYAFVFIHLCAVVIADNHKAKGIVSGMINGNK